MYKEDDYLIYGKQVCRVEKLEERDGIKYYILRPIKDESLKIQIPTTTDKIRDIISKEELDKLLEKIPEIELIDTDKKYLESTYRQLLQNGTHEDLIRIIKTTYLNNQERLAKKKKVTETDKNYFELAEECLYEEFSITLGKDIDATRNYVISKVDQLVN